MKGMFLGVKVYKLKKPILLGTNIVALLSFCLVTGVILASGGIKVKKPEAAKADSALIETLPAEIINSNSINLKGSLTYEDKPVLERGFEWGTNTSYGNNEVYPQSVPPYLFQQRTNLPNPSGYGLLNPAAIAIDSNGKTYVAVPDQHVIEIFGSDGSYQGYIGNPGINGSGDSEFNYPYGVAVDSSDNLYVADTYNNRIQVFNSAGVFQRKFGNYGTSVGQLNHPYGIDVSSEDKVFIANTDNDNVEVFDQFGTGLGTIDKNTPVGLINYPQAVKVRSDGLIYISDSGNSRILIYNSDYTFNSYIGTYIQGATSSEFAYLGYPKSLEFDSSNNLYIANQGYPNSISSNTVVIVNPEGNLAGYFGSSGGGDGQFSVPWGLAFKKSGEILTSSYYGDRLQSFSNSGFSKTITPQPNTCNTTFHYRAYVVDTDGKKYGQDQTFLPCSIDISTLPATSIKSGSATFNGNIQSADPNVAARGFEYENMSGQGGSGNVTSPIYNSYIGDYSYNQGISSGYLQCNSNYRYRAYAVNYNNNFAYGEYQTFTTGDCPYSNTLDAKDVDYNSAVLRGEQNSQSLKVYSRGFVYGNEIKPIDPLNPDLTGLNVISDRSKKTTYYGGSFGSYGTEGQGKFNNPKGITVMSGTHFVLDTDNNLVQAFDANNNFINQWGGFGTEENDFNFPQAITNDGTNFVYVLDSGNKRIKAYYPDGSLIKIIDTTGTENELNNPQGISYFNNKIYVSDTGNDRVVVFDANSGAVLNKFGSTGSGSGEFIRPIGIYANDSLIYVVDNGNNRVLIFDKDGAPISSFGSYGNGNGQFNSPTQLAFAEGSAIGALSVGLNTIAISDTGNNRIETFISIFSTSLGQLPIFQSSIGKSGSGENEFNSPTGIFIDPTGTALAGVNTNIYVTDSGNNRIETITDGQYQDGEYETKLTGLNCGTTYQYESFILNGAEETDFPFFDPNNNIKSFTTLPCEMSIDTGGSSNTSPISASVSGSITYPGGFINKRGFQYGKDTNYGNSTLDTDSNREDQQKYVSNISTSPKIQLGPGGEGIYYIEGSANLALTNDNAGNLYVSNIHLVGNADEIQQLEGRITKYDSNGVLVNNIVTYQDIQALGFAGGIAVDGENNIYATNPLKGTVQKFNSEGALINEFAVADPITDIETQQPYPPIDLALDTSNNIYITDPTGNSIRKYTNDGIKIWEIKNPGIIDGQNNLPVGIELDEYNNVYVVDSLARKVTKYDSNGGYLLEFGGLGSEEGKFLLPLSVSADKRGSIYVNDLYKRNIQVFDESGNFKRQFTNNEGGIPLQSGNILIDAYTIYFSGLINFPTSLNSTITNTYVASPILGIKDYRRFFPLGSFESNIAGLNCGTTYHYRAYGTNQAGTYYGPDKTFTTNPCGTGGGGGGGGSTTPLNEAPPTTTGAGFLPGTKAPASEPAGPANPLTNALRSIPRGLAVSLPYLLLLLLIILAILYAIQSYREYQSTKRLNALIRKYQDLQYGGKNFIALTSHYLNTPIGIMQFSSELLVSLGLLTKEGATKVASSIKNIKDSVLELLKQNSAATEQIMNDVDPRLLNTAGRKSVLNPRVWVPLVVAAALLIITDMLFVYAKVIRISFTSLFVQIFLFVICTALLVLAFRSLARNKYLRDQKQKLIDSEKKLMDTKKDFITKTIDAVENDIKELKAISASFKTKKQAEPFMRGLAMIIAVENSFALLNKFAGYQPSGSVNTNDINEVIKNVLTRQDKVVKDKALNIAQNVEPDISMGLDKSALIVLLGSTIGNAIKFSNNEGTVEINVRKRINDVIITVQDNGLGIAKDKLNSLMMPFTRATDVMKYDYEGIGLGLYMDRIILEQIDGSIKLSSSPGKGTIVRMTIPNNGLAEEATNTKPATSPLSTNPTVRPA